MSALAAVLLALVLLTGCDRIEPAPAEPTVTVGDDREIYPDAPAPAATPEPPSDVELIQELVRRRGAALQDGDPEGVRATTVPAQRRRDRRTLAALAELRARDVALELEDIELGSGVATLQTALSYRIADVPGRFRHTRTLELEEELGGGWRVARDRPAGRERYPWEVTDLRVRRGAHFVVVHPEDIALGDLPQVLERGYAQMRDAGLPGDLAERYLVTVGADPRQAEELTSGITGLDTLAAIADSDVRERGEAKVVDAVVAQRLLLVWSNFAPLDAEARATLVTHELAHLALAERTSGRTPSWLIEGAALLVSGDERIFEPGAPSLAELSRPRAMARLSGQVQADAYGRASAAAFHIAQRYGRKAFFALYDAFNDPGLRAPDAAALADAATRKVLGVSLERLDAALGRA